VALLARLVEGSSVYVLNNLYSISVVHVCVQATLLISESSNGPAAVITADHIIAQSSSSTATTPTGTAAAADSSSANQQLTNAFATLAKLQCHVLPRFQLPTLDQVTALYSNLLSLSWSIRHSLYLVFMRCLQRKVYVVYICF
jgi:hypothetical protein